MPIPFHRAHVVLAAGLAALAVALPAAASDFEITPLVGYRAGGSFRDSSVNETRDLNEDMSFGIALDLRRDAETQWEVTYSRQDTDIEPLAGSTVAGPLDLRVEYLQIGGTYFFSETDHKGFDPYVVGGLGITRFAPDIAGINDRIKPSLNIGIGMRFPVSKRVALRLEGRGYVTILDSEGSVFCSSDAANAACVIHARTRALWQVEALFGVAFRL